MPYVHMPRVIFSEGCIPFLQEWDAACMQYGDLAICHDETVFNVLMWKHGLCDWYINLCDPYYALAYDYLNGGIEAHLWHGYKNWIGKIDFYTFHGCKNPEEARSILTHLIAHQK